MIEWIVSVIRAMYKDATKMKVNGRGSKAFIVIVRYIKARFSVHCNLSLYLRLCLESLEKAFPWSCL